MLLINAVHLRYLKRIDFRLPFVTLGPIWYVYQSDMVMYHHHRVFCFVGGCIIPLRFETSPLITLYGMLIDKNDLANGDWRESEYLSSFEDEISFHTGICESNLWCNYFRICCPEQWIMSRQGILMGVPGTCFKGTLSNVASDRKVQETWNATSSVSISVATRHACWNG